MNHCAKRKCFFTPLELNTQCLIQKLRQVLTAGRRRGRRDGQYEAKGRQKEDERTMPWEVGKWREGGAYDIKRNDELGGCMTGGRRKEAQGNVGIESGAKGEWWTRHFTLRHILCLGILVNKYKSA